MRAPQCLSCDLFKLDHTCRAFICGIPDDIFEGDFDHRNPYPGDDGHRYQKRPKSSGKGGAGDN